MSVELTVEERDQVQAELDTLKEQLAKVRENEPINGLAAVRRYEQIQRISREVDRLERLLG